MKEVKILYVENNDFIAPWTIQLVKEVLEERGCSGVHILAKSSDELAFVRDKPDLVVLGLDHISPDGCRGLAEVRRQMERMGMPKLFCFVVQKGLNGSYNMSVSFEDTGSKKVGPMHMKDSSKEAVKYFLGYTLCRMLG